MKLVQHDFELPRALASAVREGQMGERIVLSRQATVCRILETTKYRTRFKANTAPGPLLVAAGLLCRARVKGLHKACKNRFCAFVAGVALWGRRALLLLLFLPACGPPGTYILAVAHTLVRVQIYLVDLAQGLV